MKSAILALLLSAGITFGSVLSNPVRSAPDHWLIAHGDSITWNGYELGGSAASVSFLQTIQAAVTVSKGYIFGDINVGMSGCGFNYNPGPVVLQTPGYYTFHRGTITEDALVNVDPFLARNGSKKLIIFAGTNDIFSNGRTGAQTAVLLQAYVDARISAGWAAGDICVVTMLPRQGTLQPDRAALNSDIRSKAVTKGYLVADVAANSTIGDDGDEANTTYYDAGQVHPTNAGNAIIAGIIQAVLYP